MTAERLEQLLQPFLASPTLPASLPADLYTKLGIYLDLLLRWNGRTNLTAIREPEEIVTRHFGEGLFAALQLRPYLEPGASLLDFGSGAGFPGIPIQLAIPELSVMLAESQGKKASFLREAVRVLGLKTEVWPGRVEAMPAERRFSAITLRAVDRMQEAVAASSERLFPAGILAELASLNAPHPQRFTLVVPPLAVPASDLRMLRLWRLPLV